MSQDPYDPSVMNTDPATIAASVRVSPDYKIGNTQLGKLHFTAGLGLVLETEGTKLFVPITEDHLRALLEGSHVSVSFGVQVML